MKGIEKASYAMLAIILLVIVLVIAAFFVLGSKGSVDILMKENSLRQCCSKYCSTKSTTEMCNTIEGDVAFGTLAAELSITDHDAFCNC